MSLTWLDPGHHGGLDLSESMFVIHFIQDIIARVIVVVLPRVGWRRYFELWERRVFHVTPVHFYQPIPDTSSLSVDVWSKRSSMGGVNLNEPAQIEMLDDFRRRFADEYDALPRAATSVPHEFHYDNSYFACVDPEILYCMIRTHRPSRIVEIGSGFSTLLSATAIRRNAKEFGDSPCELIAIEPYPNDVIRSGFPGLSELRTSRVQDVKLSTFESLGKNDILFIDSSHVGRIDSDVLYEILEILPRLQPGVLVHFHDIFLPDEYPKSWVIDRHRFWTEQYLLHAFLAFNDSFEVLWAGQYMHRHHPDRMRSAFASYRRRTPDEDWVGPGSFWIRRR